MTVFFCCTLIIGGIVRALSLEPVLTRAGGGMMARVDLITPNCPISGRFGAFFWRKDYEIG